MLNRQGRPTQPGEGAMAEHPTFTGNRALMIEEPLLFEIGRCESFLSDTDLRLNRAPIVRARRGVGARRLIRSLTSRPPSK